MNPPIVKISEGLLQGVVNKTLDGEVFYSFLGIPYAKPPVGDLRFQAPVAIGSWEGIKDATKNGNICIQKDMQLSPIIQGTENCLHLNVFTKHIPPENTGLKPVIVFIHGGAFLKGSNSTDEYGPEYLLSEDIVLVVPNYRLGILGFLNLKNQSLQIPGNAGLKDQRLALKWVQRNIKHFGGNPNNVTVCGHSAGATSLHYHTISPFSKGLFHKAILLSGSVFWTWTKTDFSLNKFLDILNIKVENDEEILKILKSLPAEELLEAQEKYLNMYAGRSLVFVPVIEYPNETAVIIEDPIETILNGTFTQVPIIASYVSNEGLLFEFVERYLRKFGVNIPNDMPKLEEVVPNRFRTEMDKLSYNLVCSEMENTYKLENDTLKKSLLLGDTYFIVPLLAAVNSLASLSESPVYLMKWTIDDELNYTKKCFDINDLSGTCCHGDELGYLFKTKLLPTPVKGSVADRAVKRIVKLIKNFIETGNPTPYEKQFGLIWQPFEENNQFYLDFGIELTQQVNPESDRMRFWQKIFEIYRKMVPTFTIKLSRN